MKQETNKKKKKWLLPVIIAAVVLAIAGAVLAFFMLPGEEEEATAQSKLYWNVDRLEHLDPETGLSARPAGEDGLYTIRFAVDGEQVDLKCADKRLITTIDAMDLMGLVFDADGLIVDAVAPGTVAKEIAKDYFVKTFDGTTLTINSSMAMSGMAMDVVMNENTGIYDMTPEAEVVGAPTDELGVMDKVFVYGTEDGQATHVFRITRSVGAEVYHRLYRKYDKVNKETSRVPEKGVYTIEFAHKGQLVDLKCKDKAVVDQIDKAYDAGAQMGLIFDDEGYIIKMISAAEAIKGQLLYKKISVTAVDGDMVTFESKYYANSDIGEGAEVILPEDVEMYLIEADCEAHFIGEKTDHLKVGDRCYVYADFDGNIKMVYVERRMVESELYYNIGRMYDSTTLETTRIPENGYYVYQMAVNGKQITVKTKDKEIANKIDSQSTQVVGLKLNGNIIEAVYGSGCVVGVGANSNRFVTDVMGGIVRIVTRDDWNSGNNYMLAPDVQIYDITNNCNVPVGSITELNQYDWLHCFMLNELNQITHMYIKQRYIEDGKLVYHTNQQYDSTKKETARIPNEEGYYVFEMLSDGKLITMKTKDKSVATWIDKNKYPVTVKLSGDLIKGVYSGASCVKGGTTWRVTYQDLTSERLIKYTTSTNDVPSVGKVSLPKDCTVYNYSVVFDKYRGEKTTPRQGENIYAIYSREDYSVRKMFVYSGREIDAPLYWHVNRLYNYTTNETARVPDADGWYVFQFAVDGQIKTMKTKDKSVATKADVRSGAFSVIADGDIMLDVITYPYTKAVKTTIPDNGVVTAINGNKITVKGATTNKEYKLTLAKKCKIYNVSTSAKQFGAVDVLSVGDQISGFVDDNDNVCYIYIRLKYNPPIKFELDGNAVNNNNLAFAEGTTNALCSVCNKTVTWTAVTTDADITEAGHYYLANNIEATDANGLRVISDGVVCLHLNGHNISNNTNNSNLTAVTCGSGVLNILGKGTVHADNKTHKQGGAGAVVADCENTVVNLCGGTYTGSGSSYSALGAKNGAAIKIYKGVTVSGGNMGIYGEAAYEIYGGALTSFFRPNTAGVGTVVIKAGSVNSTAAYLFYIEPASATITGGVFNLDPSAWVPEGCAVVKSAGFWYVGDDVNNAPSGGDQPSEAFDPATTVCEHCGVAPEGGWTEIPAGTAAVTLTESGHYYLSGALNGNSGTNASTGMLNIAAGATVCLHSNGQQIRNSRTNTSSNNPKSAAIRVAGTLNYFGAGTVVNNSDTTEYPSVVIVSGGSANIYGGTFSNFDPSSYVATGYAATENGNGTWTVAKTAALPTCPMCNQGIATWTELDQTAFDALTEEGDVKQLTSGHYRLTGSITSNAKRTLTIPAGNTVCLDLNGNNISNVCTQSGAGVISCAGTLNIIGDGNVTCDTPDKEGAQSGAVIAYGGTVNLYGGTYSSTNSRATLNVNTAGTLNVYEGVTVVKGYLVQKDTGVLNISGGSFGTTFRVKGAASYITVTGGTFTAADPTAYVPTTGYDIAESEGTWTVTVSETAHLPSTCPMCNQENVTWTEVTAATGDAGFAASGHYYLANDIQTGNKRAFHVPADMTVCLHLNGFDITNTNSTTNGPIALRSYGTLRVMGEGTVTSNGTGTSWAPVVADAGGTVVIYGGTYVTEVEGREAVRAQEGEGNTVLIYGGTFSSNPDASFIAEGHAATDNGDGTWTVVVDETAHLPSTCPMCNQENVTWTEVTAATGDAGFAASGHYYLANDINDATNQKRTFHVPADMEICLHLNGFNITNTATVNGPIALRSYGTLRIMGEGTVTSNGSGTSWAPVVADAGGTVVIYGGTYVTEVEGRDAVKAQEGEGNTVLIYGGTFSSNPNASYIAEGHVATDNGDGTWTVAEEILDLAQYVNTWTYAVARVEERYTDAVKQTISK